MTDFVDSLVAAHLDTWNAPGGPDRERSVASIYAPDVTIGEPEARRSGHTGMAAAISALQEQLPNTIITRNGPIQVAQELATYTWASGREGRPPIATGRDILIVGDGVITAVFVLIDTPEA